MASNKSMVAFAAQYPKNIPGYYAQAFKKTPKERMELAEAKRNNKAAVARDYPEYTPAQRKKILNPKKQHWDA